MVSGLLKPLLVDQRSTNVVPQLVSIVFFEQTVPEWNKFLNDIFRRDWQMLLEVHQQIIVLYPYHPPKHLREGVWV